MSCASMNLIEPEGIECPKNPDLRTCYYEMDCEHASKCDNCNELVCYADTERVHYGEDGIECEDESYAKSRKRALGSIESKFIMSENDNES